MSLSMAKPVNQALQEVNEAFMSLTELLGFISNDEVFKKVHGFSMTEFIELRYSCASKIREVADYIDAVVKNAGIAKVAAGTGGLLSGGAIIGGIIFAPFTGGLSLGLTAAGVAGAVASATTGIAAAIIKDKHVKSSAEEVRKLLDSLEEKDKVVCKVVITELQAKIKRIRGFYNKKGVTEVLEDAARLASLAYTVDTDIVYKGHTVCSSVKARGFTSDVAEFVQADLHASKGVHSLTPSYLIFGNAMAVPDITTVMILKKAFTAFNIVMGVWDIIAGAQDIVNGSEHAKAYRKAASEVDKHTKVIDDLLDKLTTEDD